MNDDKYMLKAAAYIIPRKGGQVLLSLRKDTGFMDGYYSLVAGHLEADETIEEAAIREAREESGVQLTTDQLRFVLLMHRVHEIPNENYIDALFEVKSWEGEFVNTEPEKCGGLDWFDITKLPENIVPYVRHALLSYNEGKLYTSWVGEPA